MRYLLIIICFTSTVIAKDSIEYLDFVKSKLHCKNIAVSKDKTFWDNKIELMYKNELLESYKIKANYNCDGVITYQNIDHSFNFDKKIEKLFNLSDFFKTNQKFLKFIRSKLYADMNEENCRDKISFYIESEDFLSKYLHFYFDEKYLYLSPVLPKGISSCYSTDTKISFEELREKATLDKRFNEIFPPAKDS